MVGYFFYYPIFNTIPRIVSQAAHSQQQIPAAGHGGHFNILLHPIIDFKIWNATKFIFVIRDQNAVYRKGMRGKQHIKGTDGGFLFF